MTFSLPRFREGQPIRRDDLLAERSARLERRWQHGRTQHSPGVLSGLEIDLRELVLHPGAALDDNGRLLVVPTELPLFPDGAPAPSTTWAVWLGPPEAATSGTGGRARRRCAETAVVSVRRIKSGVPSSQLAPFARNVRDLYNTGPADLSVFLGRLSVAADGSVTADRDGISFAGAYGEAMAAPSGSALLTLGHLPEAPAERLGLWLGGRTTKPAWSIDRRGQMRFSQALHIEGDLTQETRAPAAAPMSAPGRVPPTGLHFWKAGPPAAAPRPWSLARVAIEEDGRRREEWRLELEDPGEQGDPAHRKLLIGSQGQPVLKIRPDGRIVYDRELEVTGDTVRQPIEPSAASPAFAAALTEAMLNGLIWALVLATMRTGVAGEVTLQGGGAGGGLGVEVVATGAQTTSDAAGRFFLAHVGWPGEVVTLRFTGDGIDPQERQALVGALGQTFEVLPTVIT